MRQVQAKQTRFGAGGRLINAQLLYGEDACFEKEEVPFAPSGLAAGSLTSFVPGARDANTRMRLSTLGDILVFAFVEHRANARVVQDENGFEIGVEKERYGFDVNTKGDEILTMRLAVME
ncbi:MAG: hypothetical protein J4F29_13520 [Candidatus Latescibacteria bacterium]|nr:hypothetical protein [Candidatus Latescibacterota bacterium]